MKINRSVTEYLHLFSAPSEFHVAVMMSRKAPATGKAWLGDQWRIKGVIVGDRSRAWQTGLTRVRTGSDGDDYLWSGLTMRLHKDEVQSYYHNLMAENPKVFVISNCGENGVPQPFLVSASFDEAHAYLEAEGEVEALPMPPEICRWIEGFVLSHYIPERKIKRKRRNWSRDSSVR